MPDSADSATGRELILEASHLIVSEPAGKTQTQSSAKGVTRGRKWMSGSTHEVRAPLRSEMRNA
jgi:hypothetical protein